MGYFPVVMNKFAFGCDVDGGEERCGDPDAEGGGCQIYRSGRHRQNVRNT